MNKFRENPNSPLHRQFHSARRSRAAFFSTPWMGYRYRRPQFGSLAECKRWGFRCGPVFAQSQHPFRCSML
ncbi:hypothetical protein Y032_0069g357 [Ancylostoma ceylanicum]|uniref:Uncharacterized protein n=1 Tax=Ancylostoma ceylanicum TaxID=53326 RepID=A0A016TYM5_9BILA|nr:hypothetical protein Y032_0069g357 [Ancylostoma ceylanicum]